MSVNSSSKFDLDRIGGRGALYELITEMIGAGEDALQQFRAGVVSNFQMKPDAVNSPLTAADQLVERRLRRFLAKRFPDVGFLGEETGLSEPEGCEMRFVVDPIDGTRSFIRGLRGWAVLVGLEADGEPVVGVAYMPVSSDLYLAVKGEGTLANGRPVHVSGVNSLASALLLHGGLNQFTTMGMEQLLVDIGNKSYSQRGFADFGGYRTVMHGRADAMIDPGVQPWDICAPAVLIREAGGVLTSFEGEQTIYGGNALVSNGLLHEQLLEIIRGAQVRPSGDPRARKSDIP